MHADNPDPSLAKLHSQSQPTVLVIDDQPSFCSVVCEVLRHRGCIVHGVHSAREAFALLEELTPDLILTDLMMPDIDGLRLVRWLRSKPSLKDVPTVVVSAKSSPEDYEAASRLGADAFLTKPFSTQVLYEVVSRFVDIG